MKFILPLLAILSMVGCAESETKDPNNVNPIEEYRLTTDRLKSPMVYEFTPKNAPNVLCVVVRPSNYDAITMECFRASNETR